MHPMRRGALAVFASIALATVGSPAAQSGLVVTSITSQGVQADGRYHVRLAGTFDSPADIVAVAMCDGRLTPSTVHSATRSALAISIPLQRGAPQCTFSVHRLTDGAVNGPSIVVDAAGDDEIRGSIIGERSARDMGWSSMGRSRAPRPSTCRFSAFRAATSTEHSYRMRRMSDSTCGRRCNSTSRLSTFQAPGRTVPSRPPIRPQAVRRAPAEAHPDSSHRQLHHGWLWRVPLGLLARRSGRMRTTRSRPDSDG